MIKVSGVGGAAGQPDVMRVHLAVSVLRPSMAEALAASERSAATIRAALAAGRVAARDAVTSGLALNTEQVWDERTGPRITGYRSEHQLALTLRDLAAAGRVLGEGLAAGGNEVRLDRISFEIEDDTALRAAAREAAWADALARAEQLAALSGRELGPVRAIDETIGFTPPGPMPEMAMGFRGAKAADATEVGLEPGSVSVQVTLTVEWSLAESP